MKNIVKIFDFDKTFYNKTELDLLIKVKYHNYALLKFIVWYLLVLPKIALLLYCYRSNPSRFYTYLYRQYKGFSFAYLKEFSMHHGLRFFRKNIFIEALHELDESELSAVVSPGLDIFLQQFFCRLGLVSEYIFANSLKFVDGICTGEVDGAIIDDSEKVKCINKIRSLNPGYQIWAYWHDQLDLRMFKIVDKAFLVNPSHEYAAQIQQELPGVQVLRWKTFYFNYSSLHHLFLRLVAKFFCKEIQGNKIQEDGAIIIANHQSMVDHYLIGNSVLSDNICFIAKKEHFESGFQKFYFNLWSAIPIDRQNKDEARSSIRIAKYALLLGLNMIIYPEGTRTPDGKIGVFKYGFIKMAELLPAVKIFPITIIGAYQILPKNLSIPNIFKRAKLIIHEPVELKEGFDQAKALEECFNIIKNDLPE